MRQHALKWLYKRFPFDLRGDCGVPPAQGGIRISCVINFYGRLDLLAGILHSLLQQSFAPSLFEVVLVEDRNGTDAGRQMAGQFSDRLPIVYLPLDDNFGKMGYSRNFGLKHSRGDIVLFLDDDTVITQENFLETLVSVFNNNPDSEAVVPHGHASYSLLKDKYDFHDPYFMTSRCTAYRRSTMQELGGFMDYFVGQEDVEFVTRFTIAGKHSLNSDDLHYFHPPLLVPNTRKPRAVGFSFYGLNKRYSWPVWLILLGNCSRHAPLILLPARRCREQGRFGLGFICGIYDGIFGKQMQRYG
ncbi:MAG: glycosyltransferase family 2 protein [Desulfuromonadales bacterium]|nr:glycosyltransferase family 2 protein [Desulfuromonadales bacterium]